MLVSDLYAYVRSALDSDSTELPDALLAVWFAEAENRMFEVVQDSNRFVTTEFDDGDDTTAILALQDVVLVSSIHGPNWKLKPIQHERALERWPLNYIPDSASRTTGPPTHWSQDADDAVWLWPAPSEVESYGVTGSIAFTPTGGTTSAAPDFDASMVPLIGEYLCARGYELQQNVTSANLKMARFEGELDMIQRQLNRPSKANNTVLGGARSANPQSPTWRLRFPWE